MATPTATAHARWCALVAAAAAPGERGAWPCFRLRPTDEATLEARASASRQVTAGGDDAAMARLLGWRGLTPADLRAGWSDVEYVAARAPDWVTGLRELLLGPAAEAASPDDEPAVCVQDVIGVERARAAGHDPRRTWRFQRACAPLLRVARARLSARLAASAVDVQVGARHGLLVQLARRWHDCLHALLLAPDDSGSGNVHERFFPEDAPVNQMAWLALGEAYPAAARVLALPYVRWDAALAELLAHLEQDREALALAFGQGNKLGALIDYAGGLGDTHAGRSVAALSFASGVRVVYKPKDLRVAGAYHGLVQALTDFGLLPALRPRTLVLRDTHAWEAHVQARPCADEAAVRDYHRRLGAHARLLQLLDGSDFTAPNVVASGDEPALIDLETLLSPRVAQRADARQVPEVVAELVNDSPFPSGILTLKVPGLPGRRAADLSPLATAEQRLTPFGSEAAGDAFEAGAASVVLHGQTVDSTRYFPELVEGYLSAWRALAASAARPGQVDAGLGAFAGVQVRFVYRSTHVYTRLLAESLQPAALRDAWSRERVCERLWRALPDGRAARVTAAEIEALRDLDVPYFTSRADDDSLGLPDGTRLPGFFEGSAVARARTRWLATAARDPGLEHDLVASALYALSPTTRRNANPGHAPQRAKPGQRDWLGRATRVGDALLASAIGDGTDRLTWIGLSYHPWMDTWRFLPLVPDLLAGSAGLAIVLAELFVATGAARFERGARQACQAAEQMLADWPRAARQRRERGLALRLEPGGAHFGPGAWAYACQRVGHLLGDGGLLERAATGLARLLPLVPDELPVDVPSGAAGLLLASAACLQTSSSAELLHAGSAFAQRLADRGDEQGRFPAVLHPTPAPAVDGLPDGDLGIAYARVRWNACAGVVAEPAGAQPTTRARRATAGELLARLGAAGVGAFELPAALADVDTWLATQPVGQDASLEAADVALVAARHAPEAQGARFRAQALQAAARLDDAGREGGGFFPSCWAADRHRPCALDGLGAIARLYLALAMDTPYVSLRLLE